MYSLNSQPHRRQLLRSLAAAGAVSLVPGLSAAERDRDRIKAENDREGTTDWQLTYTRIDPKTKCARFGGGLGGRSTMIEGYCAKPASASATSSTCSSAPIRHRRL
jgi:hypothetical protein